MDLGSYLHAIDHHVHARYLHLCTQNMDPLRKTWYLSVKIPSCAHKFHIMCEQDRNLCVQDMDLVETIRLISCVHNILFVPFPYYLGYKLSSCMHLILIFWEQDSNLCVQDFNLVPTVLISQAHKL